MNSLGSIAIVDLASTEINVEFRVNTMSIALNTTLIGNRKFRVYFIRKSDNIDKQLHGSWLEEWDIASIPRIKELRILWLRVIHEFDNFLGFHLI